MNRADKVEVAITAVFGVLYLPLAVVYSMQGAWVMGTLFGVISLAWFGFAVVKYRFFRKVEPMMEPLAALTSLTDELQRVRGERDEAALQAEMYAKDAERLQRDLDSSPLYTFQRDETKRWADLANTLQAENTELRRRIAELEAG